ncbi:MAG TPA: hypothetical protein VKZ18_09960 [Polyangia bacterium]|nr:hypothetical protein [Polyangia bacterium]
MPNTLDAILMCGGCGRPTLHLFHERRNRPKEPGPAPVGPIFKDLIYVCDVCETERIWGNEPVTAGGWASELEAREEHAVLVHGMRSVECPSCHGADVDCSTCGDTGEVFAWGSREPCGPDCPLEQPEGR